MTETHTNAPIFVVGSPRSGTSVLTWCLGQHPNILPLEESDWIGPFAVNLGVHYATGTARGERSQLSALGVESEQFFQAFGDTVNALLLDHRRHLESNSRASALRNPEQVAAQFSVSRNPDDPKSRWVDGTPEYALFICGLRKLFPHAKFVHITRDVRDVVASLLSFRLEDGSALVADAQEAYERWERAARACFEAEQALGSEVVYRLRYADLIEHSETAMRGVLEFLGEPFVPACIEPLTRRINSSFDDEIARPSMDIDSTATTAQAQRLSDQLQQAIEPAEPVPRMRKKLEADFDEQVGHRAQLPQKYRAAVAMVEQIHDQLDPDELRALRARGDVSVGSVARLRLRRVLAWCGAILLVNLGFALALNVYIIQSTRAAPQFAGVLWLAVALVGVAIYAWLRRAGLLGLFARIVGRRAGK